MISKKGKKLIIPLNMKVVISVIIGILLAFAVYVALNKLESTLVYNYYTSDKAYSQSLDNSFAELREYIKKKNISSTDSESMKKWLEDNPYTYLTVYDNYGGYFEDGWVAEGESRSTKIETAKTTITESTDKEKEKDGKRGPRLTAEKHINGNDRVVSFSDDDYYVYMEIYREEGFRRIMKIVELIVAFVVILGVVTAYTTSITARIADISKDVTRITSGDINADIQTSGSDEIGVLAEGIDNMRYSLIERLEGEKAAWDANSRLITSMSHDIRTPLTSLVGYLDIIEGGKYESEDELHQYIQACRNKAFQLKELSDKLFQYFLVFGGEKNPQKLEVLDGDILFQQLLTEHVAELISYGYIVTMDYKIEGKLVETDISSLRRLFDNIFSNIMKYADKRKSIKVNAITKYTDADKESEEFLFRFENKISHEARQVESTKIGVMTCEKIAKDLGGRYSWSDDEDIYITQFAFPVHHEIAQAEDIEEEKKEL